MRTTLKAYSLITLSMLAFSFVFAAENPLVEKKKTYSKSYTLGANDKVRIENKFGELNITTWNKNEISVEVIMTAKGSTEERANYILDRLKVNDGKNSGGVWFETDINDGERRQKNTTYKDEGFSINYKVQLPAGTTLNASNEFGSTTIGDYNGPINLTSKFGSLNTGKISNAKLIRVEFGTAQIAAINNGEVEIKFSRALIDNMDGSVKANFEHCSGIRLNIDNNLRNLNLRNEFTNLFVNTNKSLSATFNIYTNFGELKNRSDFELSTEKDDEDNREPKFDKLWLGKSGKGNTDLRIKSNFGTVTIGHDLTMDLKEDKKTARKKTTSI